MRTRDTASGVPEVLEIGDDPGPPRLASTAAVGALCLALGLGGGAALQREVGGDDSRGDGQALLSAATVIENANLIDGSRYLVTLGNVGGSELTIGQAAVEGWSAGAPWVERMSMQAGSWAEVPVHVAFDCGAPPPPPEQVVVEGWLGDDAFRQVLPLSSTAGLLAADWENRCQAPAGRAPTAAELEGLWLVQEGESLEGSILLRFLANRTLVLMDGTTAVRFSSARLGARYALSGSRLTAEAETGYHCRFGRRWEWRVVLSDDDRLYLRYSEAEATGCRRDLGQVWVAERVDPALSPG